MALPYILWLIYFLFVLAVELSRNISLSFILDKWGSSILPSIFILRSIFVIVTVGVYIPLSQKIKNLSLLKIILLFSFIVLILAHLFLGYLFVFIAIELIDTLFRIHWGVVLLEFYELSTAKRIFPKLFTALYLGQFSGGILILSFVKRLKFEHFIILSSTLLSLIFLITLIALKREEGGRVEKSSLRELFIKGISHTFKSRFALIMMVATFFVVSLFRISEIIYSEIFISYFRDSLALAKFFGNYSLFSAIITFSIQLFLSPRIIESLGITRTNLLYSSVLFCIGVFLLITPGLIASIVLRWVRGDLRVAIRSPLINLFYSGFREEERSSIRGFVVGVASPIFTGAIGLGLYFYDKLYSFQENLYLLTIIYTFISLIFIGVVFVQNSLFKRAIKEREMERFFNLKLKDRDWDWHRIGTPEKIDIELIERYKESLVSVKERLNYRECISKIEDEKRLLLEIENCQRLIASLPKKKKYLIYELILREILRRELAKYILREGRFSIYESWILSTVIVFRTYLKGLKGIELSILKEYLSLRSYKKLERSFKIKDREGFDEAKLLEFINDRSFGSVTEFYRSLPFYPKGNSFITFVWNLIIDPKIMVLPLRTIIEKLIEDRECWENLKLS